MGLTPQGVPPAPALHSAQLETAFMVVTCTGRTAFVANTRSSQGRSADLLLQLFLLSFLSASAFADIPDVTRCRSCVTANLTLPVTVRTVLPLPVQPLPGLPLQGSKSGHHDQAEGGAVLSGRPLPRQLWTSGTGRATRKVCDYQRGRLVSMARGRLTHSG